MLGAVFCRSESAVVSTVFESYGGQHELVEMLLLMCTNVYSGGSELRDLYIVSGLGGTDSDRAGSVFRYRSDVAGVPQTPAAVRLGNLSAENSRRPGPGKWGKKCAMSLIF